MATRKTTKSSSGGAREAHTLEDAVAVGFLGREVDPTPDENYTVAGVIAGKPVPETHADALALATESAQAADPSSSSSSDKES